MGSDFVSVLWLITGLRILNVRCSGFDGLPAAPTDLHIDVKQDELAISWKPVPNALFYIARIGQTSYPDVIKQVVEPKCSFANYDVGVSYRVGVAAVNEIGEGPKTIREIIVEAVTPEHLLPGPVANIQVKETIFNLLITWDRPIENGWSVSEYMIKLGEKPETVLLEDVTSNPWYSVGLRGQTQIRAGVQYLVTITAVNNDGQGKPANYTFTTKSTSLLKVPEVASAEKTEDGILVSWRNPNVADRNFANHRFPIRYKSTTDTEYQTTEAGRCEVLTPPTFYCQKFLLGLDINNDYIVNVRVTYNGQSSDWSPDTVSTDQSDYK